MKIKNYLMAALGFGILVGSIILAQPFVSHSQNQVPPIPVEVINTPLEIRSVDKAPPCCVPKDPFRKDFDLLGEDGKNIAESDFIVPSGKRLVIENVSVRAFMQRGDQLEVGFTYGGPSLFIRQDFPITPQVTLKSFETDDEFAIFVASQQMRVYVDGGDKINLFGIRRETHRTFRVEFSISGFLVDL